jgi:GMP reductase
MRIENDRKLDFTDVLIRPKRSTLSSRSGVDVNRTFRFLHTGTEWSGFPLIAANMDVTGTFAMARVFSAHGALVALHKHYPTERLVEFFRSTNTSNVFYSLGMADADGARFEAVKREVAIPKICLDVANGYTEKFVDFVQATREENPDSVIMAGNVVTGDMTEALLLAGADIVKVGIGPGSVCTTRRVTGSATPSSRPSSNAPMRRMGSRARSAPMAAAPSPAMLPKPMAAARLRHAGRHARRARRV